MNFMRKHLIVIFSLLLVLSLLGCDALRPHATLEGTVTGVYEGAILIDTKMGPCSVTLPDGDYAFAVGDLVKVIFSGEIAESYPMQIHHVYDIERMGTSQTPNQ